MDGEEEQMQSPAENQTPPTQGMSATPDQGRKSRNLKEATAHLREEAIRRYKLKHGQAPSTESEVDKEVEQMEKGIENENEEKSTYATSGDPEKAMESTNKETSENVEVSTSQPLEKESDQNETRDIDKVNPESVSDNVEQKSAENPSVEDNESKSKPNDNDPNPEKQTESSNNENKENVTSNEVEKDTDSASENKDETLAQDEIKTEALKEDTNSDTKEKPLVFTDEAAEVEDVKTGKPELTSAGGLESTTGETKQADETQQDVASQKQAGSEQQPQTGEQKDETITEPTGEQTSETITEAASEKKDETATEQTGEQKDEVVTEQKTEQKTGDGKPETSGTEQTVQESATEGSAEQSGETTQETVADRPGSSKEKGQLDEQVSEKSGEQTEQSSDKPAEQSTEQSAEKPAEQTEGTGSGDQSEQAKQEVVQRTQGEVTQQETAGDGDKNQNANNEQQEAEEGDENENAKKPEGEEGEEQAPPEEEEVLIPEDFYYNFEEQMSKPVVTQESGLPEDLLTLKHSFGYDCQRRANLFMLDSKTLIYIAGNLVQILDIESKEQSYIRSTSGGGIGALAIHPTRQYFAVGEKGHCPNINIFEFPSLKLYRILRGGTERAYSSLDFSRDGELLTSVGADPDFMLTVWNWKQEKTMLRSKAFSQEVFRATFSTELEGQLTTAGTGHIRFWKMADTFTGLKLQGELGRFGKTEISDIEGYVELPDGKVLSGSEWGNMLLWEGGLIKVEITRKHKKPCHHGGIQQILLDEGELMTIGVDGYIRMWDFEAIDTADSSDETGTFEMEPMNELRVSQDAQLRSIIKSIDDENEPTIWYSQDANGGIWKLDLSFSHTSHAPEKIMTYHAGPITASDTSPITHLMSTIGADRTVRVFDFLQDKQLCEGRYNASGTCLLWAPRIVDTKGSTLVAGFEDGVVRILTFTRMDESMKRHRGEDACELALKQVLKPHKSSVTALAFDNKGEILASGGSDSTVFFMNVGSKEFEPIGFVQLTSPIRSMQWSPDSFNKTTLLVFCEEGNVFEIQAPEPGKFDTSHSFKISGLEIKSFQFKSIKSRLRHEEEMERKRIEEEARKKKEEEERRRRIERGLETESENGDEEEEEKKPKEEEWQPYIPTEPSPILSGFYSEEGKFWLSMGDFDAGYLYECQLKSEAEKSTIAPEVLGEPIRSIPVLESDDVPISVIQFSHSGQQALFGMENGMVRIQQLENKNDLTDLGPFWSLSMHDNIYGHVTSLKMSHDGKSLLTTGADGNFFQFSFMDDAKLEEKIKENKAKLPSARKAAEREITIDDIDDPNAYSIEDAKQKSEYDKMMREAEEKKRDVRRKIAKLRRQFRGILEKNEGLPKHIQLEKAEFEMDREIKLELQRHTQEKIEVVRKELAWESEKHRIALEKLRKRFKDVVECERIVLKAFLTPHEVASFRANKLSDDFYQLKADFERRRTQYSTKDDMTRDPTRDLAAGQLRGDDSGDGSGEKSESSGAKVVTSLKGSMGERITKALQKVEEKKKKRAARRAEWEELYNEKPDDDYEDPADVSAIHEAKDNMGDYKLKTASDYVVPDHLRMNVEKARGRLLVLKDLIHEHKYNFNVKLLSLRDKKIRTIEQIRHHVEELHKVQAQLNPAKHKPVPSIPEMFPEELPEKKLEYTRETLIQFKKDMESQKQAEQKQQAGGSGFGGGFGGFGGGSGGGGEQKQQQQQQQQQSSSSGTHQHNASPTPATKQSSVLSAARTDTTMEDRTEQEVELSPLQLQIQQTEEIRMVYLQDDILSKIEKLLKNFDAELRLLRHDKFEMDIVMKNADLRQVTLFEELVLLKEFEKREDVLAAKVTSKQQEKLDMQNKILEVQGKIDGKRKDIEKLQERDRTLNANFVASLGENNKFAEYLTKVFKKKIKRSKKKATEGDGSDEDSDEDSDDESDWEESDEESDEEAGGYDLDVCPQGCDQTLYDNTCQLREKRLDIEEGLAEEKKNADTMKKEVEGLNKKAKIIDGALKTAQNDLEAFQLEKQQKLNELDVVVTLKLSQIQYMINNVLPQDLSQTLVFESSGVVRLQQRIKELEHEKYMQKKYMKDSRRQHVQLIKDRKVFEGRIVEMEDSCSEMMVSKFGRIVDLEKLETVTVNRNIEELKERCRITEIQCAEELTDWDKKIAAKREQITYLIQDNTRRLEQLTMLNTEKKELEKSLDSRQRNLGEEYTGQRKADINEKQRLIQLVQLQAQEIDALKEEIMLLSRKGGHILPPAQPPLPQSPGNLHSIQH